MTRIRTLTPADVQHIQSALRIAIRTERTYLKHDRAHMPPGAIQNIANRIRAFEQLADGLSSSAPPELPMDADNVDMLRRENDRLRREAPDSCPACGYDFPCP